MPASPNKQEIITEFAQKEGLIQNELKKQSIHGNKLNTEIVNRITEFYESDDISSQSTGIKDFILCSVNGDKVRLQKRYMLTTIKEAFGIFCINDPVISKNVSFTEFADLRPVHVLLHRNIPHNVCLCKIHENVKLLLNCLDSQNIGITSDFKDLINQVVCDANRESLLSNIVTLR